MSGRDRVGREARIEWESGRDRVGRVAQIELGEGGIGRDKVEIGGEIE